MRYKDCGNVNLQLSLQHIDQFKKFMMNETDSIAQDV
jgi:hypothetical protein